MDPRDQVSCSSCVHHKKVAEVCFNKFDGVWLFRCDYHGVHLPHFSINTICRDYRDVIDGRNELAIFRIYAGFDLADIESDFLYWNDCFGERGKMLAFSQMCSAIDEHGNFLARHIKKMSGKRNQDL